MQDFLSLEHGANSKEAFNKCLMGISEGMNAGPNIVGRCKCLVFNLDITNFCQSSE